jgi:1,4-dihydroxy-2-naphthoyl-CoA synthase
MDDHEYDQRDAETPPRKGILRMVADQLVMTDVAEDIATITINRPDKLNALNVAVRRLLIETLEQLGNDPAVRESR